MKKDTHRESVGPAKGRILVTGGAGYIGSHTVIALMDDGWQVEVVDNLSTGSRHLVPKGVPLHVGDIGNQLFMTELLEKIKPEAVAHFAACISVPESVANPLKYYSNNFVNSCRLVEVCVNAGVERFIFSSTAAVYGMPKQLPVSEQEPTNPMNPYGRSKLMTEEMLRDVAASSKLRYVALRYFNVAGADPKGRSGQVVKNSTNLIKVVCELAAGRRDGMTVYGDDYRTADGTCIRDYIHVTDLADAHVAALEYLMKGGASEVMNCGYGSGYSVKSVLRSAGSLIGRDLNYDIAPRRSGDPAEVIADARRIRDRLSWSPRHDDLDFILRTAIAWERTLPADLVHRTL